MKKFLVLFTVIFLPLMAGLVVGQETSRSLYVLNGLGRTISKMDLETNEIMNDIEVVGDVPNRIYTHEDKIYVVTSTPAGISVIDGKTDKIVETISLTEGSNPWDMAFVGTDRAYVTNLLANTVTVLDLATGDSLNSIEVGINPQGILVVNNTVYVANTGGFPNYDASTISIIDILTDRVSKTLAVPPNPQGLALAPDGNIHVLCTGNYSDIFGQVVVINPFGDSDFTPLVTDTLAVGGFPGDIAITNAGIAYLADFGDGTNGFLFSYDTGSLEVTSDAANPILVGNGATSVFFDALTNALYVNNFLDDNVQLLSAESGAILNTFAFGDGAQNMAILEPIVESDPWPDAVFSFAPGPDAGFGQNFFPANVLGPPDPDRSLSSSNPSNKPQEILSLGSGGEIVLEFADNYIVDGNGVDFTVFENAFYILGDPAQPFIEAAYVAVSTDGQVWVEFPWDTTTFSGFAGVTPTNDNQNPTDPSVSGGDSFDLADVGLFYARFVKLTDIGDLKQEGPFSDYFDLDAVVAVNSAPGQPTSVAVSNQKSSGSFELAQNYPNPFNPSTTIRFSTGEASHIQLRIFNLKGQLIRTLADEFYTAGSFSVTWDGRDQGGENVASGLYIYQLKTDVLSRSRQLVLLR